MQADEGVRLPGAKRDAQTIRAAADGLDIPDAVLEKIKALATP
jgi:LDH2 family malate/lactate/ureidoglycolate dehydrogenase